MNVSPAYWQRAVAALVRAGALALLLLLPAVAAAADAAQLAATRQDGFARMVLSFPERLDLPPYKLRQENNVIILEFEEPIAAALPDLPVSLPEHVAAAKVDPDGRGIRFGLRGKFILNSMEAGERLYIDLLPPSWQGLPPGLPPEVVTELAERAKRASVLAEQRRKAEQARLLNPTPTLRVGHNPTFLRLQFDWSIDTEARFSLNEGGGYVEFDWPVPVDVSELKTAMPQQLRAVDNRVSAAGSRVSFKLADGIVPRFYANSKRQYVIDIDLPREEGLAAAIAAGDAARLQAELAAAAARQEAQDVADASAPTGGDGGESAQPPPPQTELTPIVSTVGHTVRIAFPFDRDTAAAVFRRGDVVWMLFETAATISAPANGEALDVIARRFQVTPAGGIQVVRLDLAVDRLATLGSEGRAWVLSLGDVLLSATEPLTLARVRDEQGRFRMTADLAHPAGVHQFRDPVVGDVLQVVTAYPPSRGLVRTLEFVDFAALKSAHGLVLKPFNADLAVSIEGQGARIEAGGGLTLSALDHTRRLDTRNPAEFRGSFIDLGAARENNPAAFARRREELIARAAANEGRLRDVARLDLAQFLVANQFAPEAIGVLGVLEAELRTPDLRKRIALTRAIANVLARRSKEALTTLNGEAYAGEVDAVMWRAIARADVGDFDGARLDALAAESAIGSYPTWVQATFLLSAARAALEARDPDMTARYLGLVEFAKLDPEQVSFHHLLQGRLAETEQRVDEALDIYGQVIAADVRPTRTEAVYRTLQLLDKAGRLDVAKAIGTLSAEVLLWRGDRLEADMQRFLAELYFRNKDYRNGFETVKQLAAHHPESPAVNGMLAQAEEVFADLYLNGRADELGDLDALTLYYDFRQLTPAGQRGDEMIRNLARRLVKVDLLRQAGDLLEYQVDSRLRGVAQAQVAADLAVIRLADRDPEGALRTLNRTRLAEISPPLERQRRIIEARALIDAGRQQLALDLLSRVTGRDADLLRVDGYWASKNYARAAELIEVIYAPTVASAPLTQADRMNIIKAGVGFVIAGDGLGLSRLRSKFGEQLAQSAEWPMFDFVTSEVVPSGPDFAKVAHEVSGLDSLNAFLAAYRSMYAPSDAVAPTQATPLDRV